VTWFQVGALSVKQAQGGEPAPDTKKEPARLWIYMKDQKKIEVYVKREGKSLSQKLIKKKQSDWDFQTFHQYISGIKKAYSDLDEVFILPTADTLYENIVKLMDKLRQENLLSIGLTPL